MPSFLPRLVLMVGLVVFCAEIKAQEPDTILHREIGEVDVYAKGKGGKTSVVQSIGGDELCLVPTADIGGALRLFSGVTIRDYGGTGGLKTVSVRSLGASHTAIEYDGVPVSNTQAGQVDISRFDVSTVSELKLSVGQSDNLLKPARLFASGAVLGICSSKDLADRLRLTLKTGSYGYMFANVALTKKVTDHLGFRTEGEYMRSDGMYSFELKNVRKTTTEKRRNTDIRSGKVELSLFYNDSARNSLDLKMYGYASERGLPGSVIFYNNCAEERLLDKIFFVQGDYKRRFLENLTTKFVAKYNYSFNRYTDRNVMYSGGKLVQNSTQNEVYMSLISLWQVASPLSLSVAVDESFNTLDSDITDRGPERNSIIVAANLRYNFNDIFTVTAGGVFTHVRETTAKGGHLEDLDRSSPYLSASAYFAKWLSANVMLKKTFRVPTFNELYYTTLGSTGLRPEDAAEFDCGVSCATGKWHCSVDFYRNSVTDKIVAIPTMYIWKMSNYGKVKITGLDISAGGDLRFRSFEAELSARYSYQKAVDVTDEKSKLYENQIPYTPLHSGSANVTLRRGEWAVDMVSVLCGRRYFLAYNIPDNEIDPYAEFSASVCRNFKVKDCDILAKLSCINFTDKQYDVIKYYPMPGRQFQLQVSLTL